jgi:hypothetical protein
LQMMGTLLRARATRTQTRKPHDFAFMLPLTQG